MELLRYGLEPPDSPVFDLGLAREPTVCFLASSRVSEFDWELSDKPEPTLASRFGEQTWLPFLAGILSTSSRRHSPRGRAFSRLRLGLLAAL
jgi:hypothetical protein